MIETMVIETKSGEDTGMVIECRYAGPGTRDTLFRIMGGGHELTDFMTSKEAARWVTNRNLSVRPGSRRVVRS